jgi:beta-galactosidase
VLIRSTRQAGKIKVRAEVQFPGVHAPTPAELEIESVPYALPMCYQGGDSGTSGTSKTSGTSGIPSKPGQPALSDAEKAKMLQEVEAQQADFGIQK